MAAFREPVPRTPRRVAPRPARGAPRGCRPKEGRQGRLRPRVPPRTPRCDLGDDLFPAAAGAHQHPQWPAAQHDAHLRGRAVEIRHEFARLPCRRLAGGWSRCWRSACAARTAGCWCTRRCYASPGHGHRKRGRPSGVSATPGPISPRASGRGGKPCRATSRNWPTPAASRSGRSPSCCWTRRRCGQRWRRRWNRRSVSAEDWARV